MNVVRVSVASVSSSVPPCTSAIHRAIDRPRPLPATPWDTDVVRAASARKKRSKTCARASAGMPGPPFDTVKQMTAPLLVRLPADLHDRFRRWTTTNGFSMAAVARGLIERFLDVGFSKFVVRPMAHDQRAHHWH